MRQRNPAGLILVLALLLAGCASAPLKRAAIASEQLALSVERIQTEEILLYRSGVITIEGHREWQGAFRRIAQGIMRLNAALRSNNGEEIHVTVQFLIRIVEDLTDGQVIKLKPEFQLILVTALESMKTLLATISTAATR